MNVRKRAALAVLTVAVAGVTVVGLANASVPDANGVIHACRKTSNPSSGQVLLPDSGSTAVATCPNGYASLAWNQSGVPGKDGVNATGIAGADGTSGTSGRDGTDATGINGADGTSGTSGRDGIDATGAPGVDGTSGTSGRDGTDATGIQGPPGANGADGSTVTGPSGPVGPTGPTGPAGNGALVGEVYFDTFFAGADDNARIASLNAWNATKAPNVARPTIVFDARTYNFSTPIDTRSGMKLRGTGMPSREFGTGTIFNYQGAAGTSLLRFVANSQGYPSDGSPRDMSIDGIEFHGGSGVDFLPRNDPTSGSYAGKVVWMSSFHNTGFVGFATIWWGWGDGTEFTGITHLQGVADTAFYLGGSENVFFTGGFSFQDNSTAAWASSGKPFFRSRLQKSTIGLMMFSARGNSYQLSIEGGNDLDVDGTYFDAPDSAPTNNPQIQVSGGTNTLIRGANFKGGQGIKVSAGEVLVQGCRFQNTAGALLTQTGGIVKWGMNIYAPTQPKTVTKTGGTFTNGDPGLAVPSS